MGRDNDEGLRNGNPEMGGTLQNDPEGNLQVTQSVQFIGPLPPPSVLKGYDEIIPGGAERILIMAEKQLEHRIERETKISNGLLAQSERGQHYALTVSLSALVGAVVLA